MKRLILVLIICLFSIGWTWTGGWDTDITAGIDFYTVATLPGSPTANDVAGVTDGADSSDCDTGGGTTQNLCVYDGADWQIVGDGDSGGATAYDDIGDPDAAGSISFADNETATYLSAEDTGNFMHISLSDADLSGETSALRISLADNDENNGIFLELYDDSGGDNDLVFKIGNGGKMWIGDIANNYTMPTADGNANDVLATNGAGAVAFTAPGDLGIGATAWDDIADPDNNDVTTIDFNHASERTVFTTVYDPGMNGSFYTLNNSDADLSDGYGIYLLDLDYSVADGDTAADFLKVQDAGGVLLTIQEEGNLDTTGTITSGGVVTSTGFTIGSAAIVEAELETIDGITAGTAAASKAVVLDASKDIATINSLTATTLVGALTGAASGNLLNSESDTLIGTLTADGLTLGANENITLGGQTLDHDGTDFVFNDSVKSTALNLTGLTASEIVITDASKNLSSAAVATYPSLTELSYVKGLSSAVQTQITAKGAHAGQVWTGAHDFGGATLEIPNGAGDFTMSTAGQVTFNSSDEQISFHSAADGEISGEASISLIRHIHLAVDPAGWYDQESTYRVIPLPYIGDDAPEGITLTEWKVAYVGGDPTTELDADLYCDTTPDFNVAANATVMDVLDTTAGVSTADTGFDSATCANGSQMYIDFGADPTDANVIISIDIWFYNEED